VLRGEIILKIVSSLMKDSLFWCY